MKLRVGIGYDVHRLEAGLPFRLGGLDIPHTKGALGHSDADTLIHAICDAMLGAASLGDIGTHFPDNSNEYEDIDSTILLRKTYELIKQKGYRIVNADTVVILQKPKINPFIQNMREIIAEIVETDISSISIKATTTEKLGFAGREEGIAAHAVVLLEKE